MAIFQCHIQVISRGEGRSVVSAAAYRSASRIENNYTGLTDDYTQKGWVEYSEIVFALALFVGFLVFLNRLEEGIDNKYSRQMHPGNGTTGLSCGMRWRKPKRAGTAGWHGRLRWHCPRNYPCRRTSAWYRNLSRIPLSQTA